MKFATIIPFYQKERGLLKQVLDTALAQQGPVANTIIVIDDGCPYLKAQSELAEAGLLDHPAIILIEKPNGGAASARNRGLDCLPEGTEAVAFLDSDDFWSPSHLEKAARALDRGYDLYFADHRRFDWTTTKFMRRGLEPNQYPLIDPDGDIRAFCHSLVDASLKRHLILTSSLVVRTSAFKNVRFPEAAPLLEDDLTWAKLGQTGAKACFSSEIDVVLGKGVNISEVDRWGSLQSFRKCASLLKGWQVAPGYLQMDRNLDELRRSRIASLKEDMARHFLFGSMGRKRWSAEVLTKFSDIAAGAAIAMRREHSGFSQ